MGKTLKRILKFAVPALAALTIIWGVNQKINKGFTPDDGSIWNVYKRSGMLRLPYGLCGYHEIRKTNLGWYEVRLNNPIFGGLFGDKRYTGFGGGLDMINGSNSPFDTRPKPIGIELNLSTNGKKYAREQKQFKGIIKESEKYMQEHSLSWDD